MSQFKNQADKNAFVMFGWLAIIASSVAIWWFFGLGWLMIYLTFCFALIAIAQIVE